MMWLYSAFGHQHRRWVDGLFTGGGLAPTIMAGTHGYGFGCVLVIEEEDEQMHSHKSEFTNPSFQHLLSCYQTMHPAL